MTLENQVVSLDLAKRLKELGFKQESLFYWRTDWDENGEKKDIYQLVDERHANYAPASMTHRYELISAYTVAELGEMLPMEGTITSMEDSDGKINLKISKKDEGWSVRYVLAEREGKTIFKFIDKSEADARAKMLIYLKENNLI